MNQERLLAAIMFTDIVGYTALMGKDEQKAMELLKFNRDIQKPLIEEYNGKWLKEMGDGTLVRFPSASEAVFCALKIQERLKDNADLNLRIGIHVGEIILENGDVFGDGVNIASRLESLAPPGSVWISESVNSNTHNKQGIETRFVREEQLKNVKEPVKIYEVKVQGSGFSNTMPPSLPTHSGRQNSFSKRKVVFTALFIIAVLFVLTYFIYPLNPEEEAVDQPTTIAVLAFDDQSPDGDQEWLGDGMADEILNVLAKVEGLQVTGKTSSFSFKGKGNTIKEIGEALGVKSVLEGSVSKVGNKLRITAQLIDVETDKHIWSNRYDREASDIFSIMDEVAQNIASSLMGELSIEELDNIKSGFKVNTEAYEYYLKGVYFHWNKYQSSSSNDDFEKAERMFVNAFRIDSLYVDAYAGLADLYDSRGGDKYDRKRDSITNIGFRINPNSAYILLAKGLTFRKSISQKYNSDSAFHYYMKAYATDPNNVIINTVLTFEYRDYGLYQNAINLANKMMVSNPLDINVRKVVADGFLSMGKLEQAKQNYIEILEIDPNDLTTKINMFNIALFYENDIKRAREIFTECEKISPDNILVTNAYADLLAVDGKIDEALAAGWIESRKENQYGNKYDFNLGLLSILDMKKEAISLVDSMSSIADYKGFWTYSNLKNVKEVEFIREEPVFKEILAKAKIVHEERLRKYGHLLDK